MRLPKPPEEWTEKELDVALFGRAKGLARALGWTLNYHTLRSKGSQSGFPDRVLVRERVIYVELKSQVGKPTPEQVRWLNGLAAAGAEVYLWRPSDIDEAARILAGRSSTGQFVDVPSPTSWQREGCRLDDYLSAHAVREGVQPVGRGT